MIKSYILKFEVFSHGNKVAHTVRSLCSCLLPGLLTGCAGSGDPYVSLVCYAGVVDGGLVFE